jgi:hypothetical protein
MKIVITTQIRENYGAHDWDGQGTCPQRWKCKGGNTYVVPNLSVTQVLRIKEQGIPTLMSLIEQRNEGFEEYVMDWAILDDDAKVGAEWESPLELSWEQGRWVARRTVENGEYGYMRQEIARKVETWEMLPAGERENYKCIYTLRVDGRTVDHHGLAQLLAA